MNNLITKHALTIIAGLLACVVPVHAQDKPMNRLSTRLFIYEITEESIHDKDYHASFLKGIYYERTIIKNLQGVIGISLENKRINDICECNDMYYGTGDFKETEVLLGIRNEINIKPVPILKPLLGVDLSYGASSYSGDFSGGFFGQGYNFDNTYNKIGLAGDAGISFEPLNNLVITAFTSLRLSRIFEERKITAQKTAYNSFKWTPVEILIGVKF